MAIHFFCTSGAVTAVGPTSAQLDTGTTATGTIVGNNIIFQTKQTMVRLLRIVALKVPSVADACSLTDAGGTALISFTTPTSGVPPYDFGPTGIPIPVGGFLVTTTQASGAYLFVVDSTATIT